MVVFFMVVAAVGWRGLAWVYGKSKHRAADWIYVADVIGVVQRHQKAGVQKNPRG